MSPLSPTDHRPTTRLDTDVLVVGGGAAGVAAAVIAARRGLRVMLLERYGFCGGGAVAGLSGTVCGLYEASEDDSAPPRQVVFGFAQEFIDRLAGHDGVTGPVRYGKTFTRVHDPMAWREAADELLQEAGVRVLLHTLVTDVLMEGDERIAGVQVGVRQTRQLGGVYTLRNDDVLTAARFPTGVARCPWPIELHSGEKPRLTWLFGDSYEVPYECFVPQRGESLLVAGRCLAAEHEAMASARVTAQCFSYGHAIGHAAALAVTERLSPRSVSGRDVRNLLNRDGAQLG